jgi:hypothetical protein
MVFASVASVASLVTDFAGKSGGQVYEETSPAVTVTSAINSLFRVNLKIDYEYRKVSQAAEN